MNARAWSSDEDEYLRREVQAGTSYARISDGLPGRTRNSCIGRSIRIGLRIKRTPVFRPAKPATPPKPVDPKGCNKLLMADLPRFGRCRFPLWANDAFPTVDEMFVCGEATKAVESAWCAFHHAVCFRPIPGAVN